MADRTIALGQFVEDRAFAVISVVVGSRRIVYNDIVRSEADDFAVDELFVRTVIISIHAINCHLLD